ncbi:MAG: hypothetical protein QXL94_06565 [Candidatus Parvarchaeum sp.]
MEKKKSKKIFFSNYLVVVLIIIFVLLLVYYALTASNLQPLNVNIISWNVSSVSPASYSLVFKITPIFNFSSNQLYISVNVTNEGNKTIGYNSGCISAFTGNISPENIANLTYLKNTAACNVITVQSLNQGQTASLSWPYKPEVIKVLSPGSFNINLMFPFGFYHTTYLPCANSKIACNSTFFSFAGFTENATINIKLSVR